MSLSEYDLLWQLWELRQQESNTCQQPPSSKGVGEHVHLTGNKPAFSTTILKYFHKFIDMK